MNLIAPPYDQARPRVIAFGGGKGGVGRSTLCAEVARSMARQGLRVLCVDASWRCPTLHALLLSPEPRPLSEALSHADASGPHLAELIQETGYKNIWLLALAVGQRAPFGAPSLDVDQTIAQLHDLNFDHILLDLPPDLEPVATALFIRSDIPLLVCSPEPAAIRVTTQFLRACALSVIAAHPEAPHVATSLERFLALLPLDVDRPLLREAAEHFELWPMVEDALMAFEAYLIVNQVREGAERDLGHVLCHAWQEEIGSFPRFIASVDHEDRRWFYNRRATGQTSARGEEALSNDIERLVRHLSMIEAFDLRYPRPAPTHPEASPALRLGLSLETSANQVRQHCRRLWEGYRRQAAVNLVFTAADRRAKMADDLELLYRRSLHLPGEQGLTPLEGSPPRHSGAIMAPPAPHIWHEPLHEPEDPSYSPPSHEPAATPEEATQDALAAPALTRPPGADDEQAPGKLIERLRRQHQLSLQDLSQRAHIGLKYLTAIEQTDLEILPRSVYLRGYLREIARAFGVDSTALIEEYFRRLARYR